jgi:SAM-dependent methyltransferase
MAVGRGAAAVTVTVWHDVECGRYAADLGLWRELAAAEAGPVLDVGAGTGRVALDLAAAGHEVWALDREPELLAALAARAAVRGLAVRTVVADAAGFALGQRFGLIIVPMQTVQLLPFRAGFLAAARRHLAPGGLLALAITGELEAFEPAGAALLPAPDMGEAGGYRYVSQPTAVRVGPTSVRIERIRVTLAPDGARVDEREDVIELARVDLDGLAAEGRAAGFSPEPPRHIPATREHVGSEVALLRG